MGHRDSVLLLEPQKESLHPASSNLQATHDTNHQITDRTATRYRASSLMAQASTPTEDIPLEYFPEPTEEDEHPWYSAFRVALDKPLLRIWDSHSAVKPTSKNRIYSGDQFKGLDTFEARAISLSIHAHNNRAPTPFISFTTSAGAARRLARKRPRKRGSQMLTVINPRVRRAKGRYLLSTVDEMCYYGVRKPYRTFYRDYQDEYLCLWVVGEEEIVGHWKWDKLVKEKDWYQATILPAFRKHDKRFTAGLSAISRSVSVEVCSNTSSSAEMISRVQTDGWDECNSLDSEISPDQHQDLSSEGYSAPLEDYMIRATATTRMRLTQSVSCSTLPRRISWCSSCG